MKFVRKGSVTNIGNRNVIVRNWGMKVPKKSNYLLVQDMTNSMLKLLQETESEAELKKLNLSSKEWKLVDRYVTAVNNRWLCCGDYLYQAGMKDVMLLLENK